LECDARLSPRRHCEEPATKLRSNFALVRRSNPESFRGRILDCFRLRQGFGGQVAALAMTEQGATSPPITHISARRHIFASSRLISPELCIVPPSSVRGRREDRVPAGHPRSTVRKLRYKKLHSGIQVKPDIRPSLRSGFTAYAELSPGSDALLPPSPCGWLMHVPGWAAASPQDLTHRPRASGRHGFTVRRPHRSCARGCRSRFPALRCPSRRCGLRPPRLTPRS